MQADGCQAPNRIICFDLVGDMCRAYDGANLNRGNALLGQPFRAR